MSPGTKFINAVRLLLLGLMVSAFAVSCSDSNSFDTLDEFTLDDTGGAQPEGEDSDQESEPLLQVFSETGSSGLRVTYSPATLTAMTNVEELEKTYIEVMACVGISTASVPDILLTSDELVFFIREDGSEVNGYFDEETSTINVYSDDLDENLGTRFFWTRHGMIEYLISEHGLSPDSAISPFLQCHYGP